MLESSIKKQIIDEMLESTKKNNSKSHFLEEIFRPADSKSLRTKMTAFEMELNHGDWGSPSNVPLPSALKQFPVCSEKVRKRSFMSRKIFFKRHKRQLPFMQTFTEQFNVNEKIFFVESQILSPAIHLIA